LSEALRVKPSDVELDRSFAYVGKTKNGQPRPVHLPPQVVAELANIEFGKTRIASLASLPRLVASTHGLMKSPQQQVLLYLSV
jgi:hypothetical protein